MRLVAHQLGDLLDESRLVDLVRQLRDDDAFCDPCLSISSIAGARAHVDAAAAGAVGRSDFLRAVDDPGGREIRTGMCASGPEMSIVGSSIRAMQAPTTSPRLCGGMFVAMPTAMPDEPLTSRFGTRVGRTAGSCSLPS